MKVKMTLGDVRKNLLALEELSYYTFPVKIGYAITRNMEILEAENKSAEKQRLKLCEQYAEKGPKGEPIIVKKEEDGKRTEEYRMTDENRELFAKEWAELLGKEEIEIEVRTFGKKELEKCESSERYTVPTAAQMNAMCFMIEG